MGVGGRIQEPPPNFSHNLKTNHTRSIYLREGWYDTIDLRKMDTVSEKENTELGGFGGLNPHPQKNLEGGSHTRIPPFLG